MSRQGTEVWSDLTRRCSRAVAEEVDWASEFAREVKAATAVRLRRANRSARRAAVDVEGELRELNEEIAALALGALRARTDRRRGGRPRDVRSRVAEAYSRVEYAVGRRI